MVQNSNEAAESTTAGVRHARMITEHVPMHVISKIFQSRHLLRPGAELNSIIIGVMGRARVLFPHVKVFAAAFMSNHVHLLVQGPPTELPFFIGFIKREISRRWGKCSGVDWPGAMWHEYTASALPSPASQVNCLKYVLSQGV